ncbi:MAG: hypothetical protein JWO19_2351 [Bryobacterales bacterium]|nr:hypothetical protein [Bryobacterales bacterium]
MTSVTAHDASQGHRLLARASLFEFPRKQVAVRLTLISTVIALTKVYTYEATSSFKRYIDAQSHSSNLLLNIGIFPVYLERLPSILAFGSLTMLSRYVLS